MTQSSYPKAKIELFDTMIANMQLDATSHIPKQFLRWLLRTKSLSGKLTLGERDIPLGIISLEAEIDQEHIDDDVLKAMFPDVYHSSPTTVRNE